MAPIRHSADASEQGGVSCLMVSRFSQPRRGCQHDAVNRQWVNLPNGMLSVPSASASGLANRQDHT
jgi:hypothetical protein